MLKKEFIFTLRKLAETKKAENDEIKRSMKGSGKGKSSNGNKPFLGKL